MKLIWYDCETSKDSTKRNGYNYMKAIHVFLTTCCCLGLGLAAGCSTAAPSQPAQPVAATQKVDLPSQMPQVPPNTATPSPTATATVPPTNTPTTRPRIQPGNPIPFIKGIAYPPGIVTDWGFPLSDQSLLALRDTGAEWVSLVAYVNDTDDPEKSKEATIHAIEEAHRLGLNVLLRPKFQKVEPPLGYHHESGYTTEQWQDWANRYQEYLVQYAELAEEHEVEMFAVGYEMRSSEPEEAHWRAIIQAVREVYGGPLTYAGLPNEEADILWWDALDFIGVDGYYMLSQAANPSVEELKNAWIPYLNRLEQLSLKYSKPVIFTEIGYPSTTTAAENPGNWMYGVIDLDLQARLYQALFEAIEDKEWINGVFIWSWDETPFQGGPCDFEHTPKGKPAENVMRSFFGAPAVPLPGMDPNLPVFDDAKIATLELFNNAFYSGWDPNWSWNTRYSVVESPIDPDNSVIEVKISGNGGFKFPVDMYDTTPYQYFEFSLYREDDQSIPLRVMAEGMDGTVLINRQIRSCWYAEGGVVADKTWTRILIPLSHLNIDGPFSTITLGKWEEGDLTFWIDDVRLVGVE